MIKFAVDFPFQPMIFVQRVQTIVHSQRVVFHVRQMYRRMSDVAGAADLNQPRRKDVAEHLLCKRNLLLRIFATYADICARLRSRCRSFSEMRFMQVASLFCSNRALSL